MRRCLLGWILLLVGTGWTARTVAEFPGLRAGPFATEFPLVWEDGERGEALGTLLSWEVTEDVRKWSIAPLVAYEATPILEHSRVDVLYPLITWRRAGTETRWQLGQIFSFTGSAAQENPETTRRTTVFPVYFRQRSPEGTNDYLAVFPFYGNLRRRFFRDEIEFVLFPLYSRTVKGPITTRNFIYPFVDVREGPGMHGWQVWPLYGHHQKVPTQVTNVLGDIQVQPGFDTWFALWPLILSSHQGLGTPQPVTHGAVLPFVSWQRSPLRDNTTILWPFFTRTEDRQRSFVEWGAPWPFIGWADGEGKTARRFWPVFGRIRTPNSSRQFWLWPVYNHRRLADTAVERDRWRGLFFVYDDTRLRSPEDGRYRRERGVWPFFIWRRDFEGQQRLQVLAPVETIVRNRAAVQRSYSPLWAVYRSERHPGTGRANQSVLWNFFRRDVSTNAVHTSALFGAVQTHRPAGERRRWKIFGISRSERRAAEVHERTDAAGSLAKPSPRDEE